MKGVALYCRVSTQEQARRGESIDDQLQALRRYAEENNYIIVGEYLDEGFSARKSFRTRPSMQRLLSDIQSGEIETVLVTKLDRWFRNLQDYYRVQEQLEKHGVHWKTILEDYETESSAGRFKLNIMLSVAQHEADQTSDRIKFTFTEKRKRGEIVSGKMPKGYILIDHKPVQDDKTKDAISAFWRSYLSQGSLNKAREKAEEHGLFLPVNVCSLILRNAMKYTGLIQNCPCEPYITVEEAEKVLSTRKKAPRKSGRTYLFSGIIYCRECGGRFAAHLNRYGKQKEKHRILYNCTDHNMRRVPNRCQCKVNISEDDVEKQLLLNLNTALSNKRLEAEFASKENEHKRDIASEVEKLLSKQQKLIDLYIDGMISKDDFSSRKDALQTKIDELNEMSKQKIIEPERYDDVLPDGWDEIYQQLDLEHRRAFWFRTLNRIEIGSDRSVNIVSFCVDVT